MNSLTAIEKQGKYNFIYLSMKEQQFKTFTQSKGLPLVALKVIIGLISDQPNTNNNPKAVTFRNQKVSLNEGYSFDM